MASLLPDFLNLTPLPDLDETHVYVWSGTLDLEDEALNACKAVLSRDELDRAARFKFDKDRNHFIAARGILRFLLGHYAALTPQAVSFVYGDKGKPELANGAEGLVFNVSHSHGVGAWALGLDGLIGVDVEWVQRKVDLDQVGKRFFSEKEWAELANMNEKERRAGFFRCWTRKEAFVKALGDGISFSLKAFDVSVGPVAQITRIEGDHDPAKWTMQAFDPGQDYTGTLAFEGQVQVGHHLLDVS